MWLFLYHSAKMAGTGGVSLVRLNREENVRISTHDYAILILHMDLFLDC